MNDVSLSLLEQEKNNKIKKYTIDNDCVLEFKKLIKKVSEEETEKSSKELFELISKKGYDDENNFGQVIKLIINGADIEYKNEKKGDFPLLICARKNYINTFIVLLKAGANINQTNNYLTTATMASARHGNKEILEMLILKGADINAKCLDGDDAIISAIRHNQQECFDMLINASANINNKNMNNLTIFDINPEFFKQKNIKKEILEYKQKIQKDNDEIEDIQSLFDEAYDKMMELNSNFNNSIYERLSNSIEDKKFEENINSKDLQSETANCDNTETAVYSLDETETNDIKGKEQNKLLIPNDFNIKPINFSLPSYIHYALCLSCAASDLSILLGALVDTGMFTEYGKNNLKYRRVPYFLSEGEVVVDNSISNILYDSKDKSYISIRPILNIENTIDLTSNKIEYIKEVPIIEYGEYPQYAAENNIADILEKQFKAGSLKKTGKIYKGFSEELLEYAYQENGNKTDKYIRLERNKAIETLLSNEKTVFISNKPVWIKVSPIKWIVNNNYKVLVSLIGLFSGKKHSEKDYIDEFEGTELYKYLNTEFAQDIIPSVIKEKEQNKTLIPNEFNVEPINFSLPLCGSDDQGLDCVISDFSILLGALVSNDSFADYGENNYKYRTTPYFLKNGEVVYGRSDTSIFKNIKYRTDFSIRPILNLANKIELNSNKVEYIKDVPVIEYGDYPQYVAENNIAVILEEQFKAGLLKKTGKIYKVFSEEIIEYVYQDIGNKTNKYIRLERKKPNYGTPLSNGKVPIANEPVWIKVSPIKWIANNRRKTLVSLIGLFSDKKYSESDYEGEFEGTELYKYLNTEFAQDIIPSITTEKEQIEETEYPEVDKYIKSLKMQKNL